jgi:RNA polymerase sigma-70 factor (ECF subfamily)
MDEDSLVAGFVARRPEAFVKTYEAYAALLCSVAYHVVRDRAWAEDCVYEALLRLWRSPGAYRVERGSLRAFLIAYVRNEALEQARGGGTTLREPKLYSLETPGSEVRLVDNEEAARVRVAIAALPDDERDALLRAYYKNRSQNEIAEETKAPLSAVRARIASALDALNAALSGALER